MTTATTGICGRLFCGEVRPGEEAVVVGGYSTCGRSRMLPRGAPGGSSTSGLFILKLDFQNFSRVPPSPNPPPFSCWTTRGGFFDCPPPKITQNPIFLILTSPQTSSAFRREVPQVRAAYSPRAWCDAPERHDNMILRKLVKTLRSLGQGGWKWVDWIGGGGMCTQRRSALSRLRSRSCARATPPKATWDSSRCFKLVSATNRRNERGELTAPTWSDYASFSPLAESQWWIFPLD